jgi:hypothetical protein
MAPFVSRNADVIGAFASGGDIARWLSLFQMDICGSGLAHMMNTNGS